jgi:AcrR family transcriptional regulator
VKQVRGLVGGVAPARAARTPLSRTRVLQCALDLVDREGVDALSMRRLGNELGVEAMSLYHHVSNKEAILDGLVEAVHDELGLEELGTGPWDETLRTMARALRSTVLRHPNALPIVIGRAAATSAVTLRFERVLGVLRRDGFDVLAAHTAVGTVSAFVVGSISLACQQPAAGTACLAGLEDHDVDVDTMFEAGLAVVVAGLDTLRHPRARG